MEVLGETFTNYTLWCRRPGDELIVVIAENATSAPTKLQLEVAQSGSSPLYERVMEILDPQSVTNPTAVSQPLNYRNIFEYCGNTSGPLLPASFHLHFYCGTGTYFYRRGFA